MLGQRKEFLRVSYLSGRYPTHQLANLATTPIYDDLNPDEDLLRETLGQNLEFSQTRNSISVSSLSPELRVLNIIMFHNLYPLSSTGYMNLGRALFLHDLISDEEIDICAHIFHLLCKTVLRTDSRACIPFCCLISRILKLKGVHPSDSESPYTKQSPINICTLNTSIGHSRKGIKTKSSAPPTGSHSILSIYDEKFHNIMVSIQDISTKMSGLAAFLHQHHIRCDTKFTSFQTQLDQIQRMLEETEDQLFHDKKGEIMTKWGVLMLKKCLMLCLFVIT